MDESNEADLLKALVAVTDAKILTWRKLEPETYVAQLCDRHYTVEWIYLYDRDGIAIDREGLTVKAGRAACDLIWGSVSWWEVRQLIVGMDPPSKESIQDELPWLDKWAAVNRLKLADLVSKPGTKRRDMDLKNELELIRLVRQATIHGSIAWHRDQTDSSEVYVGSDGSDYKISVLILYAACAEDQVPAFRIARLSLPGLEFDLCSGTEGFRLVVEMLSAALPEFRDKHGRGREHLDSEITFLRSLLLEKH